ncbi:hypothetical protein BJ878DRAFT_545240 [Calycina marina]|uniref:Uncharacterized protein n=1 Tax=Calycina marina TaxID=1763456 RepID=A0A9P7YXA0_9HELO|nr:hypothetical protein BJ878DRAFT_545240 [Calycina marina]
MKVALSACITLLATFVNAYRIDLWQRGNYQGTQRSFTTPGTHSLGFSAGSWKWQSGFNDGCCVVFCRASTNVGKYCGSASKGDSSAGTTKVVIGCGNSVLNC